MIRMLMVGYCSVIRSASAPIFHGAPGHRSGNRRTSPRVWARSRPQRSSIATKHLFGRSRCRPASPKKGTQRKRFCDIQFGGCGLKEVRAGSAANDFQLSLVSWHWLGKRATPRLKNFMRPKRRWKPGVPMLMAEDGTLSSIFLQCRSRNCSPPGGYVDCTRDAPARVRRIASRAPMERRRAVSMTERMSA